MKNSIVFTLGLALITASIVPFSSASRNAYHAYITSQANKDDYRHFSERQRYSESTATTTSRSNSESTTDVSARYQRNSRENYSQPSGATRVSATSTTYVEANSRLEADHHIRPFSIRSGVAPWKQTLVNTGVSSRVMTKTSDAEMFTFETYENDAFSLELPVGAVAKLDDKHGFVVENMDIRIKRFEDGTCSDAFGFMGCATNITQSENTMLVGGKGRLIPLERVVRQLYKSDTVLDMVNVQSEVYTEELTAEFTDGAQYTLYRYAVKDIDGGVYFIEVKIPRRVASKYVLAVGQMFDSFRVYPVQ
ncbi:hypothetical protein GW756_03535 [bacterium]|nr:hypothetical protein [bacterium]NCQ55409.1 hypothetical protein [Candidatus Parcubacteria bacterium]NCS67771.1 hypothetical protein [Candidatus Peregrinibacteria bacterium]NCS96415.1 hypothetical protein [bacterium]